MLYYHRGNGCPSAKAGILVRAFPQRSNYQSLSLSLWLCTRRVHERFSDTHDNYFCNWAEAKHDYCGRPHGRILILVSYYNKIHLH